MSRRIAKSKFKTSLKLVASSLCVAFFAEVSLAASFPMTYSGRLTQQTGAPVDGPVDVTVKFWTSASAGNTLGTPIDFANVTLNQGVFTLPLELTPAQISAIFGDGTDPVFIEVTAAGKTYPRQHYTYVPLALRVPVDNKTLAFDADGKLGLSLTSLPSANQFLTKDSNGRLSWGSPGVTTLQGQTIAAATPSSGQVLSFNGGQWVPTTLTSSGSGSGSGSGMQPAGNYLTALTGDVVATGPGSSTAILASVALPGTATKVTFDVKGRVTAGTSLTSADITAALGYAPLNNAALSNGQLLIGSTGTAPVPASLSSGANAGVTVTTDAGSITLDTAQDIRPTASPTFAAVNAATLAAATYVAGAADNSATPASGMLRAANATGSDAVGGNLVLAAGNGTGTGGSGNIEFATAAADVTGETANTRATRMTITPSGNVGIGTTAPSAPLTVTMPPAFPANSGTVATSGIRIQETSSNNSVLEMGIKNSTSGLGSGRLAWIQADYQGDLSVTYPLVLNPNGGGVGVGTFAPRGTFDVLGSFIVASSGNVGIGTAGPVNALSVNGSADYSGNVGIGTTSPAQKLDVAGVIRSSSGGIMFPDGSIMTSALPTPSGGYNSTTDLNLAADSGGNGTGNISVSTKGTERVRITNSGNIGIGTTAPGSLLTVWGGVTTVLSSSATAPTAVQVGRTAADGSFSVAGASGQNSASAAQGDMILRAETTAQKLILQTGAGAAALVVNNGNVGIGTTTPLSKLDINGAAAIGSYAGTISAPNNSLIVSGTIGVGTSAPSQPLEVAGVIKSSSGGFMFPDGSVMTTAASTGSNGSSSTTDLNLNSDSGAAGSGDIMLSTRGAERMRIANSGNVGIGTNNPADKLFVWSTKESTVTPQTPGLAVGDASLANTGVGGGIAFWGNYTGTTPIAGATIHAMKNNATAGDTGFNLAFNTRPNAGKPTERMRITSTGNVGIGTTNPGKQLEVAGHIQITNANNAQLFLNPTGIGGRQYGFGATDNANGLGGGKFFIYDNTSSANRFIIDSSGNVGIGTTAPSTKLAVAGSGSFTGNVGIGTTVPTQSLEVAGTIKSSTGGIMFPDGTVMTSAASPSTGSSSITDLNLGADIGAAGSGVLSFSTAGTERMRVANNGNVGIGTTSPSAALHVAGDVVVGNSSTISLTRTMPTVVNDTIDLGTFTVHTAAISLDIGVVVGNSNFSVAKRYIFPVKYNQTANTWMVAQPISDDGAFSGADYALDVNVNINVISLRLRRTGGTVDGTAYVTIMQSGRTDTLWAASTATASVTAPTSILSTASFGSVNGNVGIGTTSPQRRLDLNSGASGGLTEQLVLRNAGASTTAGTGAGLYFALTNATASRHAAIDALISNAATGATDLTLSTYNGTSITEKMRIQAGGSVGIGTTTPFNKLSVAGSADFTGNVGIGSNIPTQALDVAGVIRSSTGGIMFPDGSVMTSAATPGTGTSSTGDLTFVADSGSTGTGVITFAARGSEKMRITNGGSIGFGTAGPLSKVDVAGGMAVGSYAGATAAPSNGLIVSGNVGIGTTSPNAPLNVALTDTAAYSTSSLSTGSATSDALVLANNSNNSNADFVGLLFNNRSSSVASARIAVTGGIISSALAFLLRPTSGAATTTEFMRINSDGNVGIGTTSVGSKLQVSGNAAIGYSTSTAGPTNGLAVSGNVGIGTTAPSQMLEVAGTIRSTSGGIMFPDGTVMTTASGGTSSGTTSDTDLAFASGTGTGTSNAGVITLATHNLERMRIDYNGNVGIGTAAPVNKLDVAGGMSIGTTYAGVTNAPSNGLLVQGNVGIGISAPTASLDVAGSINIAQGNAIRSNGNWLIGQQSGTNLISLGSATVANDIRFDSSIGTMVTIKNTGNVGIGTSAPAALLDVSGAKSAAPTLLGAYIGLSGPIFTDNSTAASATAANMAFNAIAAPTLASTNTSVTTSNAYTNYIAGAPRKGTNNTVTNAVALGIGAAAVGAQNNSYGLFVNAQTGATNNYTAVFSGGNVGIGSAAPAQKLDVAGAIRSSTGGFVFPDGTIMTTAVTATTAGASSSTDLNLVADSGAAGNGAIVVATNGTERMRVLNSGKVGIGTSIPQSALDVSGGMSLGSYAGVNTAPSNGLIVSGNVGIGTTAPTSALHVNGGIRAAKGAPSGANNDMNIGYAFSADGDSGIFMSGGSQTGGSDLLFYDNGFEKMRISSGGNVGIGTTTPLALLDVSGAKSATPSLTGAYIGFAGPTFTDNNTAASGTAANMAFNAIAAPTLASTNATVTTTNAYSLYLAGAPKKGTNDTITNAVALGIGAAAVGAQTNSYGLFVNAQTGATNNYAAVFQGGNVGIGTTTPSQRLQVGTSGDGTVALANAWNTFSDIRLKRDLAVIPDALDKLLELHGYYYFWKEGSDQTRQVGVVAQEVEKILPELVRTGSDGIKTVDYPKLTAVLIEGTKQLKAEKDSEIAQLKARADAAEAEAALLKRALCSKFRDLAVCSH